MAVDKGQFKAWLSSLEAGHGSEASIYRLRTNLHW